MFTGIISDIGTIIRREDKGDTTFTIACHFDPAGIELGASIACSGVCLTVTNKGTDATHGHWFSVDASAETLGCTTARNWQAGTRLNLERALKMGDELGGHLVSGHVDGVGTITGLEKAGNSTRLTIEVPEKLAIFTAPKGSVTLDGISLTINRANANHLELNIIPHTLEVTTLGSAAVGQPINVEADMLARYVHRMLAKS